MSLSKRDTHDAGVTIRCHPNLLGLELVTQQQAAKFSFCSTDLALIVSEGWAGSIRCKRVEHAIEHGTLLCVRPDEVVSSSCVSSSGRLRSVLISPQHWMTTFMRHGSEGQSLIERPMSACGISEALKPRLDQLFCSIDKPRADSASREQVEELIGDLLRETHGTNTNPVQAPTAPNGSIERFREHLARRALGQDSESCQAEPIRCPGLTRYQVLRLFKRDYGVTPNAYKIHLQIARARRVLRDGASLAETASVCGFFDQSHLTRHFKRLVGVTPGDYARLFHPAGRRSVTATKPNGAERLATGLGDRAAA